MAMGDVKKVMMVCASPGVVSKYVGDLQAEGYNVLVHPTANDAPEKAADYMPGVVILGVNLTPPENRQLLMKDIRDACAGAGGDAPHIIDLDGATLLKNNTGAGASLGVGPSDMIFGESASRKGLISIIRDLFG